MTTKQTYSLGIAAALLLVPAATSAASPCPYTWNTNLKQGSTGADVLALQRMLNADAATSISSSGAGSPGAETTIFGGMTRAAVVKFQEKYAAEILTPNALTKGTGILGAATRTKMNAMCASPVAHMNTTVTGPLMTIVSPAEGVSLSVVDPGQAPASLAPAGAGVLFLSFDLTAGISNVTVNSITIERTGFASDRVFDNLALFDEDGLQIGYVATLNSQHIAVFRKPFTISAGTTRSFEVYGNMHYDQEAYEGQYPAIRLTAVDASAPIVGHLPITGPMHVVNNSLLVGGGTGYLSSFDPGGDTTRYVNDKGVVFAGIRITADSRENLEFPYIIWTQSGSAGTGDIENVVTVVDGQSYPAVVSPYSAQEYISFFDPAIIIEKGRTIDVYVKGDLKPSAGGRNVRFDIRDNTDDVGFTGLTYNLGVGLAPGANTSESDSSTFLTSDGSTEGDALTPFFKGSLIEVSSGAFNGVSRN